MSEHHASIRWTRTTPDYTYETYSRDHEWNFEKTVTVPASAAVEFKGTQTRVNPETAFVAAASSCHMLTFLAIAARKRLVVDSYEDNAVGFLEKNEEGNLAVTRIVLRPVVKFDAASAAKADLKGIHEAAHRGCMIANSVKTLITVD